jgi:hypothetical protein
LKIPKGVIKIEEEQTKQRPKYKRTKHTYKNKMTLHKTKEYKRYAQNKQRDFTLKYKRHAKPYMSPTGTNKGLHIKVQKVCKAVYEPHRDKQNKETPVMED